MPPVGIGAQSYPDAVGMAAKFVRLPTAQDAPNVPTATGVPAANKFTAKVWQVECCTAVARSVACPYNGEQRGIGLTG